MEEEEEEEEGQQQWWRPAAAGPRLGGQVRVIVHLDLDCFYAQVEMLRDPTLRGRPLGVQQKSLVVTSNYEARKHGVKKLMSTREAKERCPQLLLVNGEDLRPYREMSSKVTDLLLTFCPLVERLGLDENFLDVTQLVEKKLQDLQPGAPLDLHVPGHIYNHQALNPLDPTHLKLLLGSHLAEDFRRALATTLGLTASAGVATSKVLSKLVSGTFKPDQQTLLLPESSSDLLQNLQDLQQLPGVGPKTSRELQRLGVRKVSELQKVPLDLLEKVLGASAAQKLLRWRQGEDEAPVTPSGPPQSLSEEDSFRSCSSAEEVKRKMEEVLPKLLARVKEDGRWPQTIRLTIRRTSKKALEKSSRRESRQCPVPAQLQRKFGRDSSKLLQALVEVLLKLFQKMVAISQPFQLNLLNISFCNLQEVPKRQEGSIGFYLKEVSSGGGGGGGPREGLGGDVSWQEPFSRAPNPGRKQREEEEEKLEKFGLPELTFGGSPKLLQQEVLQEGDQEEVLLEGEPLEASRRSSSCHQAEEPPATISKPSEGQAKDLPSCFLTPPRGPLMVGEGPSWRSEELPPEVDLETFSQLPPTIQEELLGEWKRQGGKRPNGRGPRSLGRRRGAPRRSRQVNTLLRYFQAGEDNSGNGKLGR